MKTKRSFRMTFLTVILFIILSLSSCHTKHLTTQKSRTSVSSTEDINFQAKHDQSYQGNRIISISDSTNQFYRVNIFPLDTFSFSIQDGFKGKASRVEVIKTVQQVKQINDSSLFTAKRHNETQYYSESEASETTASRIKSLEKKNSSIIVNLLGIGFAGALIWLCRGFWKQKIGRG